MTCGNPWRPVPKLLLFGLDTAPGSNGLATDRVRPSWLDLEEEDFAPMEEFIFHNGPPKPSSSALSGNRRVLALPWNNGLVKDRTSRARRVQNPKALAGCRTA